MAKAKGASKVVVWVILLLLIVGLAGFGATSFGGGTQAVGSVGDTTIPSQRYARAMDQELRAYEAQSGERITFQQAQSLGIDRSVLSQVIAVTALEDEAAQLRLSVGDEAVRREVLRVPAFQGIGGEFDRDAYTFALQQSGRTVNGFEAEVRAETARTLLQGAVIAGVTVPQVFVDTLFDYARQQRDITFAELEATDLPDPPAEPDDATLRAFYDENPDLFTRPELRAITYAWTRPEDMLDTVEVGDDVLRGLYDDRIAEFVQPERRLIERLVFPSTEEAQAAADAIAAGETDFDATVADRGLDLADIDLGDVTREGLGPAGDAVFALEAPGVVGPVETSLGPALIRMNGVLAAQETPFDEVKDELRTEAALGAARRAVEDEIEPVEDLLAGGATLEEVAAETPMTLGEILWDTTSASVANQDVDAYPEFREAAAAAEVGDFPEVILLADGGILALRLDEVVPPTVEPYEDVEIAVIQAWETDATRDALFARAEELKSEVSEGATLEDAGLEPRAETALTRDAFVEGAPNELVTVAFEMAEGEVRVVPSDTGAVLLRVDAVRTPDADAEENAAIRDEFSQQTSQGIAQDILGAYTRALEARKGIGIDQSTVAAVNAQFQ